MPQHRRTELVGQPRLQMHQRKGPQHACPDVDNKKQSEPESQHAQQVMVVLRHRIIDGKLHVERARDRIDLQRHRQHQRLNNRQPGATRPDHHLPQPQPRTLRPARKTLSGTKLQRHAGEMPPSLGMGKTPQCRWQDHGCRCRALIPASGPRNGPCPSAGWPAS